MTRHLDVEMERSDWDIIILHYLGLDHIGHLAGPRSPLIAPKLMEMDNIVHKLHHVMANEVHHFFHLLNFECQLHIIKSNLIFIIHIYCHAKKF